METLKSLRERKGLSQQHLADRVGVTQPYISQIESGVATMSQGVAVKTARVLGVTPQRLVAAQRRVAGVREAVKAADGIDLKTLLSDELGSGAVDHLAGAIDGLVKVADDEGIADDVRDIARRTAEKILVAVGVSVEDEPASKASAGRDAWGRRIKKGRQS